MPTLALTEAAGKAVLDVGRIVIQLAKRGGLKTYPLPLPQKIGTDPKTQIKTATAEDCRRVLRFCDAQGCVDRTLNDPLFQEKVIGGVLAQLMSGDIYSGVGNLAKSISVEIYECMKTELLNNLRSKQKTTRYRAFSRRTGGYAAEGEGQPQL